MPTFVQKPEDVVVTPIVFGASTVPPLLYGLRPEGLNHWQLIFTTQGIGKIHHSQGESFTRSGEFVLFRPHIRQYYGNPSDEKIWIHQWCMFRPSPDWQRWLNWPEIAPGIAILKPRKALPAIRTAWQHCKRAFSSHHPARLELALCRLQEVLIQCHSAYHATTSTLEDPRLIKVIEQMAADLRQHPSLSEIAQTAGLSVSQISRLFEVQVGVSPVKYLEKLRMERAAELLAVTPLRIAEIAAAVGYDDPLYFSGRFRQATGMNPKRYRNVAKG